MLAGVYCRASHRRPEGQAHRTGWGGWGWGLQDAAGVPPRVSPILRLRPGAGAVGRGAAANKWTKKNLSAPAKVVAAEGLLAEKGF